MDEGHADAIEKLRRDGASEAALAAFRRRLAGLDDPAAGLLPGAELEPIPSLPALDELPEPSPQEARAALDRVVVLKLNGGLGTSMGLTTPKSSIAIKDGRTFLDVIALQVLALRERHGVRLPLVLMDSTATRPPSLHALEQHPGLIRDDLAPDFLQGREPKLRADTGAPVQWPPDQELEWCPPGHGDLYISLAGSGMLAALLDAGYRWAFVSNADNLGALVDARIAAWVAAEQIPFLMEVVRGTPADRKGGHLARRDGRLVLRETAQVPDGDDSFGDVERWRWYNTNDLWVDLEALAELLAADPAGPRLPLIVNRKTVDPTDASSPEVLQLETAMGAAIGSIDGARALHVPRSRFVPVKTTDDLLVTRSDAYVLRDDGSLEAAFDGAAPPVVTLDPDYYKLLRDFDARFPDGPPSLRNARSLTVEGDVRFGRGVVVKGDATVRGPQSVRDGAMFDR
ncbi:MAG TPA: UTP--glucose-1-phosphate uridylyltransferase [Conexibacter sp.]|jgi:UTP--glucose-1-phosphate uridylyltransferase